MQKKTITYNDIKPFIESGDVTEQSHPQDPDVKIFNYTPQCQFGRHWNDITIQCRGLIMNTRTGELLARPFPKFFNYDEHIAQGGAIPAETPIITEKMDGSLGIMYTLNGEVWIATRGSFTSDQAVWATKWWRENKGPAPYGNEYTHLFEIIYPANRIVVNYNFSGLIHLATLETSTGRTVDYTLPVTKVGMLSPYLEIEYLKSLDPSNEEGVVIHYPVSDLRLKLKYETYVKLHKVMTGLSEIGIWELLQEKGLDVSPEEVVQDVPDEFFDWFKSVLNSLKEAYRSIETDAHSTIGMMAGEIRPGGAYEERKHQAQLITKVGKYPPVAFAILDGKDYSKIIFKMIRPKGQKTFKQET